MKTDEAMRRLSRENPVPETPPALPYDTIRRAVAGVPAGERRRPSGPRGRLAPAVIFSALGCAALAVALSLAPTSIRPTGAAAAVLNRLAVVAAAHPVVSPPAPGRYLHIDSTIAGQWVQGDCAVLVAERRELWIDAAGAGRILQVPGRLTFGSASSRRGCARTSAAMLRAAAHPVDTWYAPGCYTLGPAAALRGGVTDPTRLLREMHTIDGGPAGPAGDFGAVADFLRESDASPVLRAAVYRAAATIPGVRVLGPVRDRRGRRGIGLALVSRVGDTAATTTTLTFDPTTSALLAERTTITGSGRTIGWAVYGRPRIVASIPARIPSGLAPGCRAGRSYGHGAGGVILMTGRP